MRELLIGGGVALLIAAALYLWKSGDAPAKAVRSIFTSGGSGGSRLK